MGQPLVSVLVPVYNVEKYLGECLSSLTAQTLKDIEIIMVNDGSTDDSQKIAEQYMALDHRIQLINKENGGVGSARNILMPLAKGEYSIFVDADDYLDLNTLETVYTKAKKNSCEIAIYNGKAFDDYDTEIVYAKKKYFDLDIKDADAILSGFEWIKKTGGTIQSPCMKMFATSFLQKHKFRHIEGVAGSDAIFFYQTMVLVERVIYIDFIGYFRRYRPGSLVTDPSIKGTKDRISTFGELTTLLPNISDKQYVEVIKKQFALYSCLLWVLAMGRKNKNERKQLLLSFSEYKLDVFLAQNRRGAIQLIISVLVFLPHCFDPFKNILCIFIKRVFKSKSRLFV